MNKVTIILADDHHLVRHALRNLLEDETDFHIIGEVGDGLTAVELVAQTQPDVLVLDLMMPGLNGLDATRQISQRSPHTQVIILSMHANEAYVVEALQAGAAGYVLKQSTPDDLARAIREAMAGRRYLSPPLSEQAISHYVARASHVVDPYTALTARERQVLHLAAEGLTNAAIAERLAIGSRTVETHRANLMRKLGLRNPADLIRYALQRGLSLNPTEDLDTTPPPH